MKIKTTPSRAFTVFALTAVLGIQFGLIVVCLKGLINLQDRVDYLQEELTEIRGVALQASRLLDEELEEHRKMQCQLHIAVAGFRGGHSQAYRLFKAGAYESCGGTFTGPPTLAAGP